MSRALIAIVLLILFIVFSLSIGAFSWGPVTSIKTFRQMQSEVAASLDLTNPYIADTAMIIAADYPGQFSINQIRQIYDTMAQGGWYYFSDPSGSESYQNANLSLRRGKIKNTIGMGDCDDFAILMTSLIQSIGGSARIIFAYDTRDQRSHAYSELYLGHNGSQEVDGIISWLNNEYKTKDLPGINRIGDEVWLNLDWGSDITKASFPGGPYFGEGSNNVIREVVWQSDILASATIVPVIDSMDSTEGWQTIDDGNGSSLNISSVQGKKGHAIQISYDLQEGGWVAISREVDPKMLAEVAGMNFSSLIMDRQNTVELRLLYKDGTAFGASWDNPKAETWSYQALLFAKLKCMNPENECEFDDKINISKVRWMEIVLSNMPEVGDEAGTGIILLDDVRGLMALKAGSPWARAEEEREMSIAKDLAYESEQAQQNPSRLIEGCQLAVESVCHNNTLEGNLALRSSIKRLPRPINRFEHNGSVCYVAFCQDGTRIATADRSNTVRIWELSTGRELYKMNFNGSLIWASDYPSNPVSISPDFTKVAAIFYNDNLVVLDTISGKELLRIALKNHPNSVVFSPNCTRIAIANRLKGTKGTARIYDLSRGEIVTSVEHNSTVISVAFNHEGTKLATASYDNTARIWDASTGVELVRLELNEIVYSVVFSPDDEEIATVSKSYTVVWDASTGCELARFNEGAASVTFNPNGTKVATTGRDHIANIFDVENRIDLARLAHNSNVNSVAFSPDGQKLATASDDRTVRIWNTFVDRDLIYDCWPVVFTQDSTKVEMDLDGGVLVVDASTHEVLNRWSLYDAHCGSSYHSYFSPDASRIAINYYVEGYSNVVILYNASSGKEVARFEHNGSVNSVAFCQTGARIATLSDDKTVKIWDASTGKELARIEHNSYVESIAFSIDGTRIAILSDEKTIGIWDVSNGKELARMEHNSSVILPDDSMTFSPDGKKIAIPIDNNTVGIRDVLTGKEFARLKNNNKIYSVAFSQDGAKIATRGFRIVRIFDVSAGKELANLAHYYDVRSITFYPDSTKIVTLSQDEGPDYMYIARIWDISTSKELFSLKTDDDIRFLTFSPDGTKIATAGEDRTVRIWDASSGKEIIRLEHDNYIDSLIFSPDGTKIATSCTGCSFTRIWSLRPEDLICDACGRLGCNLTSQEWWGEYCSKCI